VVVTHSVDPIDRTLYYANGLDPRNFDLIDAPDAPSANLKSLGHTIYARPIFPLDPDVRFTPEPVLYRSALAQHRSTGSAERLVPEKAL
jgi:hypothetical protein